MLYYCQVCDLKGIGEDEDGWYDPVHMKEHILLCSLSQKHDLGYVWEIYCEPFANTNPNAVTELTRMGDIAITVKVIILPDAVNIIKFINQVFSSGSYNVSLPVAYHMLDALLGRFK